MSQLAPQPPNPAELPFLSAIVLAGGQSTRMGQDKALISLQGVPLLRRVCEVALDCTDAVAVVTAWPERYAAIVPSQCKLIQEPQGDRPAGPLVGFAHALAQAQSSWVLLLACDLPRLDSETLLGWMAQLPTAPETALLPKGDRGWEPLCGFYQVSCLPRLQRAIEQGDRSFQHWLAGETVGELPVVDRSLLFNCNTPADLEQVLGNRR